MLLREKSCKSQQEERPLTEEQLSGAGIAKHIAAGQEGRLGCSPFHAQHQAHLTHPPQFLSVLGIQLSSHFLCDYYGNSNVGQIKINQTGMSFSKITKTICVKQGCSHVPQKQLDYLKYNYWTEKKKTIKCNNFCRFHIAGGKSS